MNGMEMHYVDDTKSKLKEGKRHLLGSQKKFEVEKKHLDYRSYLIVSNKNSIRECK